MAIYIGKVQHPVRLNFQIRRIWRCPLYRVPEHSTPTL